MPIIKSAIKRAKQAEVRRTRNDALKKQMRDAIKDVETAVAAKDSKKAAVAQSKAFSVLDTAVKKNYIHKNKAANKKAALNKLTKTIGAKPASSNKITAKKGAAKKPAAKKAPAKKTTTKKPAAKKTTTAKK